MLESTGAAFSPRTTRMQATPNPQMRYGMGGRAMTQFPMGTTPKPFGASGTSGTATNQPRAAASPTAGRMIKA